MTCRPAKELVLSKEKPIPYQPPLPPNEAPSGVDAAAGVTPVGLRPPFVTPAAAHSHPDCRGIPILIVALQRVFSTDLLTHVLDIPKAHQTSQHSQRLAQVMKHAGWGRGETGRITIGGVTLRGYIRAVPFSVAQRLVHSAMGITDPPPLPVRTGICDQPLTG